MNLFPVATFPQLIDETRVTRTRSFFPALTLFLAALLAWPWNLALSASESHELPAQRNHGTWTSRKDQSQQIGRAGKACVIRCAVLDPDDYDESEEGDVAATGQASAPSPALPPIDGGATAPGRGVADHWPATPLLIALLCRLRC